MRTAIDTNILSAILSKEPSTESLLGILAQARYEGALVISPVVYVELHAHPKSTQSFLNDFFANTKVAVDFVLDERVWMEAGLRFSTYADRRRRSGRGTPKRILADFIVGAHAVLQCDRLFTRDVTRYQRDFPELRFI